MRTVEKRIRNLENCIRPNRRDWSHLSKEEETTIAKAANILNAAEAMGRIAMGSDGLVAVTGTDQELETISEAFVILTGGSVEP